MISFKKIFFLFTLGILFNTQTLNAHCEIPCGIYGDSIRINLIFEHITTIEKAMNSINKLSAAGEKNYNQLVRWVMNKEEHAEKIQEIVSQYFLHQRIKPVDTSNNEQHQKYLKQLTTLHETSVLAMKTKQSTDLTIIEKLRTTVEDFSSVYFHKH